MQAFANAEPRLSEPIVSAARRNRKRRRIHLRLSICGRAVASGMITTWSGLLKALPDSRSRLAARLIDQHQHLLQDCRCICGSDCTNDAEAVARKTKLTEQ